MAIGIDARNGYVATRGWLETSEVQAEVLAKELAAYGAETFIFTDISRDGMMQGPNVEAIVSLAKASGRTGIASGGVSVMANLLRLSRNGRQTSINVLQRSIQGLLHSISGSRGSRSR